MINVLVGLSIGLYFIIKHDFNKTDATENTASGKNELKNKSNNKHKLKETDIIDQQKSDILKTLDKNKKSSLDKGTQTDFDSVSNTQANPIFISPVKHVQDVVNDQTMVSASQLFQRYTKDNEENKDNETTSDESDAESELAFPFDEKTPIKQTDSSDLSIEQKESLKNRLVPKYFWNNFMFMKDFQFEQKDFDNDIATRFNYPKYEEALKKFDLDKIISKKVQIYNFNKVNYKVKMKKDAVIFTKLSENIFIFESCMYEELIKNKSIYDTHIISNEYYIEYIQKKNIKYLVVYKQLKTIDDLDLYQQIFHLINAIEYYYSNGILLSNFDHTTFEYAKKHDETVVFYKNNQKKVHYNIDALKDNPIIIHKKCKRYWGDQINNIQQYLLSLSNIIRLYALTNMNSKYKTRDFSSNDTFFYKDTNINVVKLFAALRNKKVKDIAELKKIFEEKITDEEAKRLKEEYCVEVR